ncbi:MAG: hypothetical protein ACTSU4_14465 [Promethearchaeota archaeon]
MGGTNLPATASSLLGSRLARLYKQKGIIGFINGLKKSYEVLGATVNVQEREPNLFEFSMEYPDNFCPIGGHYNPEKAELVQKSICTPFTEGFLKEMDPTFKYSGDIEECILKTNQNKCKYILKLEKLNTKEILKC